MRLGVLALFAVLLFPAYASAQRPELPQEVQEWMSTGWQFRFNRMVALGDSIFNNNSCARCHGDNGAGGRNGPDLTDAEWVQSDGSLEGVYETIFWGVRRRDLHDSTRRFQMNPKGGLNLTDDETRALAAYVWSLAHLPR